MIEKAKIGEPCKSCGLCCSLNVCMNGSYVLGLVSRLGKYAPGPCPAIVRNPDGTIKCGIILNPNKYIKKSRYPAKVLSKHFSHLIGSGAGCDELYDDDTFVEKMKLQQLIEDKKNNPEWIEKSKMAIRIIHGL